MITRKELEEISEQHKLYVSTGGNEGKKAKLRGQNLEVADFSGLYFAGADFIGANFIGANFSGADFSGADLRCCDFSGADFNGAYFSDANLRCSDFSGADLRFCDFSDVDFNGANLTDAKLDYQIQEGLLKEIAEKVLANVEVLEMRRWHSDCNTIHCIAGWACTLNPVARQLEEEVGTANAALLTLGPEAHSHFYDTNKKALEYLKSVLEK